MDLKTTTGLLENHINYGLNSVSLTPELRKVIYAQIWLSKKGVALSESPQLPIFLLPVTICSTLKSKYPAASLEAAYSTATAGIFLMAAGEILDDVEDDDEDNSFYRRNGLAVSVNTATTLIFLAENTIARIKGGISPACINKMLRITNKLHIQACSGQHKDLMLEKGKLISEKEYFRVSTWKSASSIENACALGAIAGKASSREIGLFRRFGRFLGLSAQLVNDIRGMQSGKDIKAKKISLPWIFVLRNCDALTKKKLLFYLKGDAEGSMGVDEILAIVAASGALHYTLTRSEYFRNEALEQLEQLRGYGIETIDLESLLKN